MRNGERAMVLRWRFAVQWVVQFLVARALEDFKQFPFNPWVHLGSNVSKTYDAATTIQQGHVYTFSAGANRPAWFRFYRREQDLTYPISATLFSKVDGSANPTVVLLRPPNGNPTEFSKPSPDVRFHRVCYENFKMKTKI